MARQYVSGDIFPTVVNAQAKRQYVLTSRVINDQITAGTSVSIAAIVNTVNQAFSGSPRNG